MSPPADPDSQAEALAALELDLERSRDGRVEERFVWIVVTTILATVALTRGSGSDFLPLAIVILELPLLFLLAKKMGIEDVAKLFDRLLSDLGRNGAGGP